MTTHADGRKSFLSFMTPDQAHRLTVLAKENELPFDWEEDLVAIDMYAEKGTLISVQDIPGVLDALKAGLAGRPEVMDLPEGHPEFTFQQKSDLMELAIRHFSWIDNRVESNIWEDVGLDWENVKERFPALLDPERDQWQPPAGTQTQSE